MRIIHEHGFESAAERLEYVGKIQQNIVTTIYTIDHAMKLMSIDYECHTLGQQLLEKILKPCTNYEYVYCWQQRFESGRSRCFEQDNLNSCLNHIQCLQLYQSIVQIIKNLSNSHLWLLLQFWDDSGVKSCLRRRNEFNLMDSASYYMSRLEDILADSYVPSIQDILRVRIPTNGKWTSWNLKLNLFCGQESTSTLSIWIPPIFSSWTSVANELSVESGFTVSRMSPQSSSSWL